MTTARDYIAKWVGDHDAADGMISMLCDAPDPVQLELTALLNPWRPIDTAPKDGAMILTVVPWLMYPKTLFWATYADEWRCPATEDANSYEPTHWLPLREAPK